MATVQNIFFPSAKDGKKGTLCFRVTHNSTDRQIATDIRLSESEWKICSSGRFCVEPQILALKERIENVKKRLEGIIQMFDEQGKSYSVNDVVNCFRHSTRYLTFTQYMEYVIEALYRKKRYGTARNYQHALVSFKQFFNDNHVCFEEMTSTLIGQYEQYLETRGVCRNSSSFYMRILRSVFNKALRQNITEQKNPFTNVYTGIARTKKRAIPEGVIKKMLNLELEQGSEEAFARDLFIFSYCARGMAYVDMAYLKKINIKNGFISYKRRKTNQLIHVKLEKTMEDIMQRYEKASSVYVFPILNVSESSEAYVQYFLGINKYNYLLGKICDRLSFEGKITSYTARHSWATIALSHNVPIYVISQGLGHESERTTKIYLDTIENKRLDTANASIIKSLCK